MVALLAMGPVIAEGKVSLPQEAHINQHLIAAAAGDILRKTCPTLEARTFFVLTKLAELKSYTRSKGYTEAEVAAFLKSGAEKTRIRNTARAYLAEAGAVQGDVASYCKAGKGEIAKQTLVGSLLRSTK